jgi:hypothetical protein
MVCTKGNAARLKSPATRGVERAHEYAWKRRMEGLKAVPQFNSGQSIKMNVQ